MNDRDSAILRGWRRLSTWAQPKTKLPRATECPSCGKRRGRHTGVLRSCSNCGNAWIAR